jgi:hypothetical protein
MIYDEGRQSRLQMLRVIHSHDTNVQTLFHVVWGGVDTLCPKNHSDKLVGVAAERKLSLMPADPPAQVPNLSTLPRLANFNSTLDCVDYCVPGHD